MAKHRLVPNLPRSLLRTPPHLTCSGCAVGKTAAAPFRKHPHRDPIGSHLHSDIYGPLPVDSIHGNKYVATFLDQGSRYLHIFCAPSKSLAAAHTSTHVDHIHATTPHRIRHFTSDNAREYYTHDLTNFFADLHICTHPSVPHTPQENGLAERINRTLSNDARSCLLTSNLPASLWEYAFHSCVDTYNHTIHTATGRIPHSLWTGTTPEIHTLLPFGTAGHVHTRAPRNKLEPRAIFAHYVGRQDYYHYYVYDPIRRGDRVFYSLWAKISSCPGFDGTLGL